MSWLAGSKLAVMALSLGSMMVLARLLSSAEFGTMSAAMLVIALASALFEGAFGIGLLRQPQLDDAQIATTFWLSTLLGLAMFLIIAMVTPGVQAFFRFPHLAEVLVVAALSIVFKAIGSVSQSLLQRRHRFRLLAISSTLSYLIGGCVVAIALAVSGFGIWALVIGTVLSTAIESVANLIFARIPFRIPPDRERAREVLRLSGFFTVSQVLNWAANTGANAVTGRLLGAAPLGIYSRGWKLLDIAVSATAQPMQRVLLPGFARRLDDPDGVRQAFVKAIGIGVCFFGALSALAVIHAEAIVRFVLGPKWGETVPVVQFLFAALMPRCCFKISESLAYAFGRSLAATVRQAIYAALMIGGAIIGARYGPSGIAAASSITVWMFYLMSVGYVMTIIDLPLRAIVLIHVRAVLVIAPCALVDLAIIHGSPLGFWSTQILGGGIALVVMLLTLMAAPAAMLGGTLAGLRRTLAIQRQKLLRI